MEPGPSTRNAQMPFDDFPRTQAFSFSSSPVSKLGKVIWQMPPPSNPALQTLMESAKKDVHRVRTSPNERDSNSLGSAIAPNSVVSNSRAPTRPTEKRLDSVTSFEINPVIAQLVDPALLRGVADVASQKAQERSKALGFVKKRMHASRKSTVAEKSASKKSRASRVVNSGMIEKTRSDIRKKEKGKGKENPDPSLLLKSSSGNSSGFSQPVLKDNDSMTVSSSNPSSPKMFDDSMSIDANTSADTSILPSSNSTSKHSTGTSLDDPRSPSPRLPISFSHHITLSHESRQDATFDKTKLHPLSAKDSKPIQGARCRDVQRVDTRTVGVPQSKTAQSPAPAVIPPPTSYPRPSANPPALGMRRVNSLPAKDSAGFSKHFGVVRDLPTKQRPFKTPFLSTTQRYGNSQTANAASTTYHEAEQKQISSRDRESFGADISEETEPDGMICDETETSYEQDSFDMDALEETLKQYD